MTDWKYEWGYIRRHPGLRLGLWLCALVALANLGYGVLGWWPARSEATALAQEVDRARREVIAAVRAAEFAEVYDTASQAVAAVETRLSAGGGQAELVQRVNRMARKSGVEIVSESNEAGRSESGYAPVYQSLSLRGRYADLRAFIGGLGELPTWTLVREVRMERAREAGGTLRAEVVLVTFRPERIDPEARL